jgi:hypothetical protein
MTPARYELQDHQGPLLWFALPYVRGGSLRDHLRREQRWTRPSASPARTPRLSLRPRRKRDPSRHQPENIVLTDDGMLLVDDYDIAPAIEAGGDDESLRVGAGGSSRCRGFPRALTGVVRSSRITATSQYLDI